MPGLLSWYGDNSGCDDADGCDRGYDYGCDHYSARVFRDECEIFQGRVGKKHITR